MRKRIKLSRLDSPKVKVVHVKSPTRLVTFDDPDVDVEEARGAFARLRPPDGWTDAQGEAWRDMVQERAIAVKVLPRGKLDELPDDAWRTEEGVNVGSIREEAMVIAEATGNQDVVKLTGEILDEVGIP